MPFKLTAGLVIAVLSVWFLAGPVTSDNAWALEESGGLSAVGTGEGEELPGKVGISPEAIRPAPVNMQDEEEFEADPPWQQTKEREEREASEREATEAAAAEREAAQAAKEREAALAAALRCVVPSLKGDTLTHARHTLRAAHCTLGKVALAHGHHTALLVKTQSPAAGKQLASEAPVKITLGPAKGH